jgi:hypothetical protein
MSQPAPAAAFVLALLGGLMVSILHPGETAFPTLGRQWPLPSVAARSSAALNTAGKLC